jgi:nucleoside-diphosphate-sugar epimerase
MTCSLPNEYPRWLPRTIRQAAIRRNQGEETVTTELTRRRFTTQDENAAAGSGSSFIAEQFMAKRRMLVTGATGMVGSFVARRALERGYSVRALVRPRADRTLLSGLDIEYFDGDLSDHGCFPKLLQDVQIVVHSAAHIGDWGPAEKYRAINVVSLEHLLTAAERTATLERWIQVSTLGVYPARNHYGTDETVPPSLSGLDGYTRTKAEAEVVIRRHIDEFKLPAVILRPGFIYGPGERHVIPRLLQRFEFGVVKFVGDGKALLNNVYVGNFVDAVFLAIDKDGVDGQIYNIRDQRLVTREEYLMTVAGYLGRPRPGRVPLWLARAAVPFIEGFAKLRGSGQPPLLTRATIKFMALNLDFAIDKARQQLGYRGSVDFQPGMRDALDWATGKMQTPRLIGSPCGSPN